MEGLNIHKTNLIYSSFSKSQETCLMGAERLEKKPCCGVQQSNVKKKKNLHISSASSLALTVGNLAVKRLITAA